MFLISCLSKLRNSKCTKPHFHLMHLLRITGPLRRNNLWQLLDSGSIFQTALSEHEQQFNHGANIFSSTLTYYYVCSAEQVCHR